MKKLLYVIIGLVLINTVLVFVFNNQTKKEISLINKRIDEVVSYKVTATMYNAVENQCDADPLITAGMYKINPDKASEHKWIAMSRNMLKRWGGEFDYGDKVLITGTGFKDGIYTVADTMNKRYTNRIDILETKGTPLYKFEDVTIQKISS